MTAPEPGSPEVRRSPDGRLIAYCRSARHGLWRKSDGYDCEAEDVADWTPLVPAVSPAPDTEALRQQAVDAFERELELARSGEGYEANAVAEEIVRRYWPDVAGLRADLDQARAEQASMVRDLLQTVYPGDPMPDRPLDTVWEHLLDQVRQQETRYHALAASAVQDREEVKALRSGARTIPDDAAERVAEALREVRLNLGPNTLEAIYGGANHLVLSGAERHAIALTAIEALGLSVPTTDPAPAAADVQWGVQRADGVLDQMDDEDDARRHLNWFDDGTAQVVNRTVAYGSWTPAPAAPQAPAEPTATPVDDYGDDIRPSGPLAPIRHEEE